MNCISIKLRPESILLMCRRSKVVTTNKLVFSQHGDPLSVLHRDNETVAKPKSNEVLLKMLASPVNPVDVNIIEGKYPIELHFPAVPGVEGVAEVIKTGSEVKHLSEGDHVIPINGSLGLWRTYLCVPGEELLQVPKTLGLIEAATLSINPCTAYRILKDYVHLDPGDTVIQNGANSSCGQNVIQLCRVWGINTVNIIRDRPNLRKVKNYLLGLGGTYVLTEDELRSTQIFKTEQISKPKLALDCVGGRSALEILRQLQDRHMMITIGGMSRNAIQIPTSALIFKDLQVYGFRINSWTQKYKNSIEWFEMFDKIISLMSKGELKGPKHQFVHFDNYKEALLNTMVPQGMIDKKYILSFEY